MKSNIHPLKWWTVFGAIMKKLHARGAWCAALLGAHREGDWLRNAECHRATSIWKRLKFVAGRTDDFRANWRRHDLTKRNFQFVQSDSLGQTLPMLLSENWPFCRTRQSGTKTAPGKWFSRALIWSYSVVVAHLWLLQVQTAKGNDSPSPELWSGVVQYVVAHFDFFEFKQLE